MIKLWSPGGLVEDDDEVRDRFPYQSQLPDFINWANPIWVRPEYVIGVSVDRWSSGIKCKYLLRGTGNDVTPPTIVETVTTRLAFAASDFTGESVEVLGSPDAVMEELAE